MLHGHALVAVVAGAEFCACGHREVSILPHLQELALHDVQVALRAA